MGVTAASEAVLPRSSCLTAGRGFIMTVSSVTLHSPLFRHWRFSCLLLRRSRGGAVSDRHRTRGTLGTGGGKCLQGLKTGSPDTCVTSLIGLLVTRYFSCVFSSWAQLLKRKNLILCFICSEAKKSARGRKFTSELIVSLTVLIKPGKGKVMGASGIGSLPLIHSADILF